MTQVICFKNKFGYCKYADSRSYKHVTLVCDDGQCDFKSCDKRHFEIVIDKQRQELRLSIFRKMNIIS